MFQIFFHFAVTFEFHNFKLDLIKGSDNPAQMASAKKHPPKRTYIKTLPSAKKAPNTNPIIDTANFASWII